MAIRLKSGDILRLPLGAGWGFAYAKYFHIQGLEGNASYPDLLHVFAHRSPGADVLDLGQLRSYLLPPTLWAGRLPTMRADRWQRVGTQPVRPEELALPDFRWYECNIADRMQVTSLPQPGATLYDRGLATRCETAVANVAHLAYHGASPAEFIEYSATLACMLREGADPADYFDPADSTFQYEMGVLHARPFPDELPPHLYGRARQLGDPGYVALG